MVPVEHDGAKIVVDISLNGERTRAIVDTGNALSFVSRRSPALWDAADKELPLTGRRSISLLDGGASLPSASYRFDTVAIGGEVFRNMAMSVIDIEFPLGSADLGLDYWRNRRIWISYPRNWMFISTGGSAPALAYPIKDQDAGADEDKTTRADKPGDVSDASFAVRRPQ